MLKRIFWAVTITFPLYLFVSLDRSPSFQEIAQWTEQPKQVLDSLKRNILRFHQEIQQHDDASMNSNHQE